MTQSYVHTRCQSIVTRVNTRIFDFSANVAECYTRVSGQPVSLTEKRVSIQHSAVIAVAIIKPIPLMMRSVVQMSFNTT